MKRYQSEIKRKRIQRTENLVVEYKSFQAIKNRTKNAENIINGIYGKIERLLEI